MDGIQKKIRSVPTFPCAILLRLWRVCINFNTFFDSFTILSHIQSSQELINENEIRLLVAMHNCSPSKEKGNYIINVIHLYS